jgi:hypothetical protein
MICGFLALCGRADGAGNLVPGGWAAFLIPHSSFALTGGWALNQTAY